MKKEIRILVLVWMHEETYFLHEDEFMNEYESDYWFNSDDDGHELIETREKKRITNEVVATELEVIRTNTGNKGWKSNDEGGIDHYQNSDNDDSPIDDSEEDDDGGDPGGNKRKRKMREKYTRYLGPSVGRVDLYVGMRFKDNKQLTEPVDNYKIVKGYNLNITKSNTVGF